LRQIDRHWQDHLTQMDHLRDGIGLRGYGSRDPKIEYKREGHQLFLSMMREVDYNVVAEVFHLQLMSAEEVVREEERQRQAAAAMQRAAQLQGAADQGESDSVAATDANAQPRAPRARKRPGRNDPCWCGSGKKYKKCHQKEDSEKDRAARATV
ncbi:MAG: SEC-C metal-binding domain-containing protein, partial [Myxococcota bacterium]